MEIIYPAENKKLFQDFKTISQTSGETKSLGNKLLFVLLFVLAIIVDIAGLISGIIDLGTAGILGWILRIVFMLIYVCYFILFWIESNKFGYSYFEARKIAQEKISQLKTKTKRIIYLLRAILATSIFAKWLPIIGAFIDTLPIETLTVVFLFYLYPRLINRSFNE